MPKLTPYEQSVRAVNAGSAMYLIEAAMLTLQTMPHVDKRLEALEKSICDRLLQEQQRLLDVMDKAHAAAGTTRPY